MAKRIDLTGQKFGRLYVEKYAGYNKFKYAVWQCKCDCGNTVVVPGKALRTGNTKSCGCYSREKSTERIVSLNTTHGKTDSRIFRIWSGTRTRCYNKNAINYEDYGGRGIAVCEEWRHDFTSFLKWAEENGYKENLTLDRKDNSKGYSPDNCRWATIKEQQNNKRSNRLVAFNGETHTVTEWAEKIGVHKDTLLLRLKNPNYTLERALTEPLNKRGKYDRKKTAEYARRKFGR